MIYHKAQLVVLVHLVYEILVQACEHWLESNLSKTKHWLESKAVVASSSASFNH